MIDDDFDEFDPEAHAEYIERLRDEQREDGEA